MIPTKFKKFLCISIAIGCFAMLNSCNAIPIPITKTYTCEWHDSIPAYFTNVALGFCSDCDYSFSTLATYMPQYSFYDAMDYLSQFWSGQYESLAFKWTGTIVDKQCTDNTKNSNSFTLNQDNFRDRLFSSDMLESIPLVRDKEISAYYHIKYSLDFQIKGVYDDNGNRGTLTWTRTWLPNNIYHSLASNSFFFTFSHDNSLINANFSSTQGVRHIYIHDHFEEY